ncbi:hypothetical protein PUN28_005523 [Cardiocondyla obscurior]|uniref:Uncharacterized protein n=1 Tax=Cardiocondyla obscurior TaxID=286306 RepID=A0AAW2GLL4_9HYME
MRYARGRSRARTCTPPVRGGDIPTTQRAPRDPHIGHNTRHAHPDRRTRARSSYRNTHERTRERATRTVSDCEASPPLEAAIATARTNGFARIDYARRAPFIEKQKSEVN